MIKINNDNTAFLNLYIENFHQVSIIIQENEIFNHTHIYIAIDMNDRLIMSIKIHEKRPFLFWKESNLKDNINKLSEISILLNDYTSPILNNLSSIINQQFPINLFLFKRLSFQESMSLFKWEVAKARMEYGWNEYKGGEPSPSEISPYEYSYDDIAFIHKKILVKNTSSLNKLFNSDQFYELTTKDCILIHEKKPLSSFVLPNNK
jgi:hypothetical protein